MPPHYFLVYLEATEGSACVAKPLTDFSTLLGPGLYTEKLVFLVSLLVHLSTLSLQGFRQGSFPPYLGMTGTETGTFCRTELTALPLQWDVEGKQQ